jgi:hypothetical protein
MLKRRLKLQRQAAADLIGLAHYSWNPQTNELKWDPLIKAMWGLTPDREPDYAIWRNGIHPEDVNRVDVAVAHCKDPRGDGIYDIKYRVIGLDGVERLIHTRGRTYFKNDKPTDFAGVMLDISPGHGSPGKITIGYAESAFQTFYQQLTERIEDLKKYESHQQAFFSGACFATRFLLRLQRASDPSKAITSVDDLVAELRQFHESRGIATTGNSEKAKTEL